MQLSETYKKLITNVLLAFVLVSIGFSLGKHSVVSRTVNGEMLAASNGGAASSERLVKIFYMHATFRCVTCNSIESKAKQLVEREFSEAWNHKKILWEEVNFQENEALAKKFDVVASCIVVTVIQSNEIIEFNRLDEVWPLLEKPAEFDAYVANAVRKALENTNGEGK
ncbi:MAG: nitrophenyl compound nitroreductase subunit ArsF family protein [Candidatus Riflebacteria bacterium]|nr:nitrophenyl compound nitroreductase subunit ArsF family protein [Candidatus Riflebacteria bacterium]